MLASLITVALFVGANGAQSASFAKAAHTKATKIMTANNEARTAVPANFKFEAKANTDWLKIYYATGIECDASSSNYYTYWWLFNTCIMQGENLYTMMDYTVADGMYNITTMYYSDECATNPTFISQAMYPSTCADALVSDNDVIYISGSANSYKASGWGMQTYATNDDCEAGTDLISATQMNFDGCYNVGLNSYIMVSSKCNSVAYYTDADCTEMDAYGGGDDDDEYYGDDYGDDDMFSCDGTEKFYCAKASAASSMFAPSAALAVIAAAVATMI